MSTHKENNDRPDHPDRPDYDRQQPRAAAPSFPDAREVGPHLVIDKTEWVPGRHPESHLGFDGQRGYADSFLRCIRCGAERQSEQGFPPECERED